MKIDLTYKEIQLIKDALEKESSRIFTSKAKLSRPMDFNQIMEVGMRFRLTVDDHCKEGICHTILNKIDVIEKIIQSTVGDDDGLC